MIYELIVRLVVAAGIAGASYQFGTPDFDKVWPTLAGFGLYSLVIFGVEHQNHRNRGIAGFIGVFDALFIATWLSQANLLDSYGFLVLIPMMWAVGKFNSDSTSMAPLVAASLIVSSNFFEGVGFNTPTMLHTLGVLVVGLLTSPKKTVVKEKTVQVPVKETVEIESGDSVEMKNSIKSLKTHIADLESSTRRDRATIRIWNAVRTSNDTFYLALASKMREVGDLDGLAIYSYNQNEKKMVIESVSGRVPQLLRDKSFAVNYNLGEGQLRHQLEQTIMNLRDPDHPVQAGVQILKHEGKFLGMVVGFHSRVMLLEESMRTVSEVAPTVSNMIVMEQEREETNRRLKESEILYGVASVGQGAETITSLVNRVLRELGETVPLDHLAIWTIDNGDAQKISSLGAHNQLFDHIEFGGEFGIGSWHKVDYPEVIITDTFASEAIHKELALKQRVGSYAMIPLKVGDNLLGFTTVSTHRSAGLTDQKIATIRAVIAELAYAWDRLENPGKHPEGVMTPDEFYASVKQGRSGHMIYFEVINKEDLIERYGHPSIDLALRTLLRKIRARLPQGGGICRRNEGDYVAFVPMEEEADARSWSNEITTLASMIGLKTADGRAKIPLGLKAKVAKLSKQKSGV